MNTKRSLSLKEDEIEVGEAPKKAIKRAQTANLDHTTTDSSKTNQPLITSFFSNSKPNTPSRTNMEEEEQKAKIDRQASLTEATIEETDSDLSYYSDGQEQAEAKKPTQKKAIREMPNVLFYLNVTQSRPQGDYIEKIHKYWKDDYKKLEIHHGYVQWLFPNFYGSAFNRDAYKLTFDEAKLFRENKQIAERLVSSYEMMLGFYGMKLADRQTGRLERAENYEERYKATLITSLHNHLRIRRILAHLNVVGFRSYAIQLVDFLETEMFGEKGGYQKHLDEPRPLSIEYIKKIKSNPLFAIIKYDVFHEWRLYGEVTTLEERENLHKNCFTSDEKDYEPSILLRPEPQLQPAPENIL